MKTDYNEFLFIQLFTQGNETEYDLMFPHVITEYKRFLASDYNVDTKGLYTCITDFIDNNENI